MDQFQLACRKVKGNGTLDSTVVYTASLGTSNGGSAVGPFLLSGNNILVGGKGWASNSSSSSLSSFRGYGQNIDYILSQQSNANNPNSGALMGINAIMI
ncbi:MAG: hypothetical protein IPN26_02155 [Bacteroidetes bacterium]|nr:hypothetical protein [Bacteroidota bacterium]